MNILKRTKFYACILNNCKNIGVVYSQNRDTQIIICMSVDVISALKKDMFTF